MSLSGPLSPKFRPAQSPPAWAGLALFRKAESPLLAASALSALLLLFLALFLLSAPAAAQSEDEDLSAIFGFEDTDYQPPASPPEAGRSAYELAPPPPPPPPPAETLDEPLGAAGRPLATELPPPSTEAPTLSTETPPLSTEAPPPSTETPTLSTEAPPLPTETPPLSTQAQPLLESDEGVFETPPPPPEIEAAQAPVDPEAEPELDPFAAREAAFQDEADPLASEPEGDPSSLGSSADGPSMTGQVRTPPPPPWVRESRETTGAPQAGGPLPEYDSSQGRWQQMEVGQFDRPLNAVNPGPLPARGGASPADGGLSAALLAQEAQVAQANQLSGRLDPPGGAPAGGASNGASGAASGGASGGASGEASGGASSDPTVIGRPTTAEGAQQRGELLQLFEDLIPEPAPIEPPQGAPEPLAPPASPPAASSPAPANSMTVALPPPPPPSVPAMTLAPPPPPPASPDSFTLAPIPLDPPPEAAPAAQAPLPIPALPEPAAASPPPAAPEIAEPAISRAGSVMAEFGVAPKVGSAGLINPQSPAVSSARPGAFPAPVPIPSPSTSTSRPRRDQVITEPQASRPKAKAKSAARRKAPAKPNMTVALINETGSPQVAEDYRSVLSQMGYRVVSVQDRPPQGLAKETVISYRGESRGQAQALAQRLPGKRVMQPTSESLPAGAVVIVR